ncbi:Putative F-box protein L165 [Frankliniella fusca]|uniref:F-box protein L165 n=1 Tax=Frankliniella fusca TaxID=407009 RepID=A0AAE1H3S9_9NEOP|nr:Putative F-box protein L165 [Frankliniella fusca]
MLERIKTVFIILAEKLIGETCHDMLPSSPRYPDKNTAAFSHDMSARCISGAHHVPVNILCSSV